MSLLPLTELVLQILQLICFWKEILNPFIMIFSIADNVGTPVDINDLGAWINRTLTFTVHDPVFGKHMLGDHIF